MKPEFDAFKAALRTPNVLSGRVYTGVRYTDAGEPVRDNYVVAKPDIPDFDDARYTAPQRYESTRVCEFDTRFVATSTDGVLLLVDAALSHLLNSVLTVPGRVCDPIRVDRSANDVSGVQFDKNARVFFLDTTFTFTSRSA